MTRMVLERRRAPTNPPPTGFISASNFARDTFNPNQTVPFTTKAGLDAAIAGMQPGDLIQYTGTSTLSITSSTSAAAYTISGKNMGAPGVVIDLGCSHNVWDASKISNYVAINNSWSGGQTSAFRVTNCSNITIYGGDITCLKGYGVEVAGPCTNVTMWDQYVHHVGGSGFWVRDFTGVNTFIRGCSFRAEVNRFCMNPAIDSHADHGTGHHGFLLHGNTGETSGNTFIVYAHDPLLPGEVSFGTTWPEGSGGSGVEIGHDGTGSYANNVYYILGENLLMRPDGTNPGSTASQFGGCVAALYGNGALNNNIFGWIEGNNCTGAVMHCNPSGSWDNVTSPIVVNHGRHTNVNQWTSNSSMSGENGVPFNLNHGIVYQDTT